MNATERIVAVEDSVVIVEVVEDILADLAKESSEDSEEFEFEEDDAKH